MLSGTNGNNLALGESVGELHRPHRHRPVRGQRHLGRPRRESPSINSTGSLDLTIDDSANDQAVFGLNNLNGNDSVLVETTGTASLTLMSTGSNSRAPAATCCR